MHCILPAEYETNIAVLDDGVYISQFSGETDIGGAQLWDSVAFFSHHRAKLFVNSLQQAIEEYERSQGQ